MSSTVLLSWDSMVAGEIIGEFRSNLGVDHIQQFQSIVDPQTQVYTDGTTPSLAYDTLHAAKEFIELPQGTVHAKEAVEFHGPASVDQPETVQVRVADKSVRRGKRNFTLEYRVFTGPQHVITAYKSFVVPGRTNEPDSEVIRPFDFGLFPSAENPGRTGRGLRLDRTEFIVQQSLLDDFGRSTATDGPIHTDPQVAAEQFGGTILQGMYLFELASQAMMRLSSPREWMSSGRLAAKVVGSSITGETVTLTPTVHQVIFGDEVRARCAFEAWTGNGKTVFVAEAEGPLSAVEYLKEHTS